MSIVWWPITTKIRTRVFSSLLLLAPPPPPGEKKRLLRTRNKLENHEGLQTYFCYRLWVTFLNPYYYMVFSLQLQYKEMNHYKNGGTRVSCKGKLAQEIMKWQYENSVSPYPLPSTQEKIFPNVHGLLSFKDVISWTNIFLASCHVQLYLDYLT